ncbi:MAG: succinate dehydrogenase assembly factor 2 family protein [Rhizobiaceae bacterium]|nr:succinate dehydrogenase assembly factor 2 family protein [Rhizobiaceae bacterium]
MTGLKRTSADLDPRRRRMLFRAWHRGIREMDLILGQYAEENIAAMDEVTLDQFEAIMAEEDNDLIAWINGAEPVPAHLRMPLFDRIAAYRPDFDPVEKNA